MDTLYNAVMVLVPMILCLSVHEYAHARSAFALGDDTAASVGRMTLNPMAHIDPLGTLLLPILAVTFGGPFFGWAKPVPINPVRFTHKIRMKTGVLLTAAAGPAANLVMAFAVALLFKVFAVAGINPGAPLNTLMNYTFLINVVLAVFHFIPVPPLDGSRVLVGLLPDRLGRQYAYLERNPFFVLIAFAILITQAGSILGKPVRLVGGAILLLTGNG